MNALVCLTRMVRGRKREGRVYYFREGQLIKVDYLRQMRSAWKLHCNGILPNHFNNCVLR